MRAPLSPRPQQRSRGVAARHGRLRHGRTAPGAPCCLGLRRLSPGQPRGSWRLHLGRRSAERTTKTPPPARIIATVPPRRIWCARPSLRQAAPLPAPGSLRTVLLPRDHPHFVSAPREPVQRCAPVMDRGRRPAGLLPIGVLLAQAGSLCNLAVADAFDDRRDEDRRRPGPDSRRGPVAAGTLRGRGGAGSSFP